MLHAPSLARLAGCLTACALAFFTPAAAPAQTIDVSLNVFYADPANVNSGGTWEVVAKSPGAGIAALSLNLSGIHSIVAEQGPRGTVNGNRNAGFSVFANVPFAGYRNVVVGQETFDPAGLAPGQEQGVFYGVGTLQNGAPNWPGKPDGTNSIGPAFTTLTNVQRVPWADAPDPFGDTAWNTAAHLVSGTFGMGITPAFFPGSSGQIFTNVGTSTQYGPLVEAAVNAIVRTNSTSVPGGLPGDFNNNGVVDAADYVLWRKHDGTNNALQNDNNLGVPIGAAHYNLWRDNFGRTAPGAGAGAALGVAVPEPATIALIALAALAALGTLRRR